MTLAIPYATQGSILNRVYSFGVDVFNDTTRRIENFMGSDGCSILIGVGLHLGMLAAGPLAAKIIQTLGIPVPQSPFNKLHPLFKVLLAPLVCVYAPIWEEKTFRGTLQEALKNDFYSLYHDNLGFSNSTAGIASRVTAIFFTSVLFGLSHFSNAIFFCCNPVLFLPQVVSTTIAGLMLGFAKEWGGSLELPTSMHIFNNSVAWTLSILNDLS